MRPRRARALYNRTIFYPVAEVDGDILCPSFHGYFEMALISVLGLAVSSTGLIASAPGAGKAIASLTGQNSSDYFTWDEFQRLYEGLDAEVIRVMWADYSRAKRRVEEWKDDYGSGVSCKMLFTNATDQPVIRDEVSIFMGKDVGDKRVSLFPNGQKGSILPGETKMGFHAKRDCAAMGCGGVVDFFLSDQKDTPSKWWAVGWKVPYSGANVTDCQFDTCKTVRKYIEKSTVVSTTSTTFLYDRKYQLDTTMSNGTTAIHHIILRKVK